MSEPSTGASTAVDTNCEFYAKDDCGYEEYYRLADERSFNQYIYKCNKRKIDRIIEIKIRVQAKIALMVMRAVRFAAPVQGANYYGNIK